MGKCFQRHSTKPTCIKFAVAAAQLQLFLVDLATTFPEIGNSFFQALMFLSEQTQVLLEFDFTLLKVTIEGREFFLLFSPVLRRLD